MAGQIVVAAHADEEARHDALALGVTLARALDAALVLAAVWASHLGLEDRVHAGARSDELDRELEALRAEAPADVVTTAYRLGAPTVVDGLHRIVEDVRADVLVLGPPHPRRLGRFGRADVALGAIHDAPCAVAVAPAGLRDVPQGARRDVVAAWDASPEARAALEAAVELVRGTGGTLLVVHVLDLLMRAMDHPWGAPPPQEWFDDVRDAGAETLAEALLIVGDRVPAVSRLLEGPPGPQLAAAAQDAAMLVMGSRGRGALRRLVLGSVAAGLLHHARTPLVVLPRPRRLRGHERAAHALRELPVRDLPAGDGR